MKNKPDKPEAGDPVEQRPARRSWLLLGLSGLFLFLTVLLTLLNGPASGWLPVHLHSVLAADYSQDPRGQHVPQVNFNVIRDVLNDLVGRATQTGTAGADDRYNHVIDEMKTPVATVTPMPGSTVFVPTARAEATGTASAPTERVATAAPTRPPAQTPTAGFTATLLPSAEPSPTPTGVIVYPTATRRPPTQPPAPTRTHAPAPTKTSPPPPTQPPPPAPTATARPTQPPAPTPKPTKPYPPPYP